MPLTITVTFDHRALKGADKYLARFEGKELAKRIDRTLKAELRPLPGFMRAQAKAMGVGRKSGALSRSIKLSKPRKRMGEAAAYTVGPKDHKRHWIIRGTQPHSLVSRRGKGDFASFGRDQVRPLAGIRHPGSKPHSFVQPVMDRYDDLVIRQLGDVWTDKL